MNAYTASSVTKQKGTVMKGPHYTKSLRWDLHVYLLFITLYFCLLIKVFSLPNTEHFPNLHGKIHMGSHQVLT